METIIVNVDSRSRDTVAYPNDSKFNFSLNKNGISNIKNIIELKVSSIEFPNTCYYFTEKKNNTFVKVDYVKYTLENGNYNSDDIIEALNDLLPSDINFFLNKTTGKVLIKSTFERTVTFDNDSDYASLGELLGFKKKEYTFEGDQLSDFIPNVIGENYFFLKINDLGHVVNKGKKYMSKVIMVAPKYEMTYESRRSFVTKTFKFRQPVNISNINIEVVDYLDNLIDFNGIPFSFTLEFTMVNNNLLKKYHELSFLSGELLEIILHDNMLEYYDRENNEKDKPKPKKIFKHNNVGNNLLVGMKEINIQDNKDLNLKNNIKNVSGFNFNYD
jgi:hypothetical protein